MSLALQELLLCCRQFDNDKATERKKEIDKFKRLIRMPETREQLDRNSESRHSRQLNWDTVFRFLQKYIQKETECLQAANPNVSAATQANRQKKMQEISNIMKNFIRWANKRGPRLKCQELLKHIMDILQDKFSCAAYGADYNSILLKDVLSVWKYWCEITQQQWSDLMTLYFKMYLRPSKDTNRVLVARIINTLVRGCCFQSESLTSKLFEFFARAMQNARQEQVFAVIEHIISALNVFLNMCIVNCRIRVCKLGEDIFPTLLCIWTQKHLQDSLKEEVIEFFRLQLQAHHPKGTKDLEKGAFAADWLNWQNLLYALYEAIISEMSHIGSRGKYSAGVRHVAVKENLVNLAADICHQLFDRDSKVFVSSVTNVDTVQSPSHQGSLSKRRRIELGWEVIRDSLQKSENDFDMIPWLQITTVLVAKYPSSLPNCELVPLLTTLHQILSQQRRRERIPYVLCCLREVAVCQRLKSALNTAQKLDLQKLWAKIWAISLRSISSHQTEAESFQLLEAILEGNLTNPDIDFWKIFSGSTCKPSSSAVKCLSQALARCTLPERIDGIVENYPMSVSDRPLSLREAVMQWLLAYQAEENAEENAEIPSVVCRSYYKVLVPHLMVIGDIEEVKSIAAHIRRRWKELLADCLPKIMVNVLPYFAYQEKSGSDNVLAQRRGTASKVFDMLKDDDCLGKQQIDHLTLNNLPEIVVEVLNTLYDLPNQDSANDRELVEFVGAMDPAPNPPYFPSYVIKATLEYIGSCHKEKFKSLVAVLCKNPDSIQKILLAICKKAADSTSAYEKHRILMMYRLFVNMLLKEITDGLGGLWAFVLRDVIYSLIHHINSWPSHMDDISTRSFSLCCDLLTVTCKTAVEHCGDALENHLHVIVGTLTPLVQGQPEIRQQALTLLKYLVISNRGNENLYHAIRRLDPFPDLPEFGELRLIQEKIKYSKKQFTLLEEINHFLSVNTCDSLPLTRLVGLNDLKKQLELHKEDSKTLLKECQDDPASSVLVKLVVNLLQLCKSAIYHPAGKDILEAAGKCLGEMGPIDFSTIALQHKKDEFHFKAMELLKENDFKLVFILLSVINNALIDQCIDVRYAAAKCAKNILATQAGFQFWELSKKNPNGPDPMLMYLQPFRTPKKKASESPVVSRSSPSEKLDDGCLWIPQGANHDTWVKTLTCALLDSGGVKSEVLRLIKPLCEVKADFCQMVLPYLIHDILLPGDNNCWQELLSNHIQSFFNMCCRIGSTSSRSTTPAMDSETDSLPQGYMDKASRRTMLAVVNYLRKQKRHQLSTVWDDNFWLDLNYLEVALTAQSCAAHFTALLYAEIYADKIRSEEEELKRGSYKAARSLKSDESSQELTVSSLSSKSREETGIGLQELLIEVYRSIGEPDSLYGCGGGKMLHPLARVRTYEHEVLWDKALVTYDIEKNLPVSTRQAGIVQALQNFGLCHILTTYLKGLEVENTEWCEELQEIRFQAAWRNMQWDHIPPSRDGTSGFGYHESVCHALQSLKDQEFSSFVEVLRAARIKEVEELCRGSLESVYSLYPTLCRLQILEELETIGQRLCGSDPDDALNKVHKKWQQQLLLLKDSDFTFQEPILTMRTVIQELLITKEMDGQRKNLIKDALTKYLLEMAKLARAAKNSQLAEKAIFQIKQHNPVGFGVSTWQLEEAQVFWDKQEQSLSLDILKQMIDKLEGTNDKELVPLYIECLRLCGTWLAETCLESPGTIMQKYLEKAATLSIEHNSLVHSGKIEAFLSLARFSDAQYQSIDNYMKSSEFENKRALLKNAKAEIHLIKEHKFQVNRYVVKIQRECELDERAMCALQDDRKQFLCKAVENYINCLQSGEEHDMRIFRLCSLWLENSGVPEVNEMMKKGVEKIPSYKFLPLMYQLAARMGTKMAGGQRFHEVLNKLIEKTSLDHPHHTLFIILALSNANKDDVLGKPDVLRRGKHIKKDMPHLDQERMDAARNIINTIQKSKAKMIKDIERLCDALITLANMDASKWKTERKAIEIPAAQPITKIKDLDDVVIPTMEIKVDPSGKYENLLTVKSFKSQFRLAGGVNLPKIIDCVGSDGKERRQLVKGRDDLRQDAVMQQVFQMCNKLLEKNSETRKRKLTIRTYKVIPLSQRSGILEWCTGTVPIGEYLVHQNEGAHKRYRPKDSSSLECRKKMSEAQKLSFEGKYQAFMDVCKNFRPVFRYFFMEKFLDPAVWFEKRLGYTRSVATSSIVCYIVGLGDRHVQNILIDEESAELVHIDLGVAFEQGKILPTPETVPFRLTRDIVDGMGITGVEGVFRRCCEKTMEVMRNSQEALLTIVEVLLYDPLFDWTMNPLKALYLQQRPEEDADLHSTLNSTVAGEDTECDGKTTDTKSINKVAERVLLRLQEKLKGVEEGAVLSVGGQVNLLIQQARDPKNLSRLFPGWQPWV
ncbi:serine-protein kinase ATM isoform X3 [Mobula hypostoma]|uniref:serine-protein kinase ATM isoform X3 n=1 Tax=Mobula hypostoma TaxID=723540 RepID=UPI002FC3AAC5